MYDLHCHILPGIDDGSKNPEMSAEMIARSVSQGVNGIVFTPHFYADVNTPDRFLEKRAHALEKLLATGVELPEYTLGAEVHFYRGMSRSKELEKLCIGKSRYILVEMPFSSWYQGIVKEIEDIRLNLGLKVIIAHIERYLDRDPELVAGLIEDPDNLIQSNSEAFLEWRTRRKTVKLLKDGMIDLLGSDSHNLTSRPPNMGEAKKAIEKRAGEEYLRKIDMNAERIFREAL